MKKILKDRLVSLHSIDNRKLVAALNAATGADAADILEVLDDDSANSVLSVLTVSRQAAIFGYLPLERQISLITAMDCEAAKALFVALPGDEQVDLYNRLPLERQIKLLDSLDSEDGGDLLTLANYPEGSAGSEATSDYAFLSPDMTAAAALELRYCL